ncbi:MAG: hypothetical protein ABIE55_02085 [Candidatus Aenigmatarchaeota archaeon]
MDRRSLILLAVILLLVILPAIYMLVVNGIQGNMRNEVLNHLEDNLKFCEILRDDINFLSGSGGFWLFCNGRPFYAKYENGNISYELNGWGWLKDNAYWDELKGCDVYKTEDKRISFFCPIDFSDNAIVKHFEALEPFSLEKIGDWDFFEVLLEDMKGAQPNIEGCIIQGYETIIGGKSPAAGLIMNLSCDDGNYQVLTDFSFITPLSSLDENNETVINSFKKSFGVIPNVEELEASYDFGDWSIIVGYPSVKGISGMYMHISLNNENSLLDVARNFVMSIGDGPIEFIKEEDINISDSDLELSYKTRYYKLNERILRLHLDNNKIVRIDSIREGFYE